MTLPTQPRRKVGAQRMFAQGGFDPRVMILVKNEGHHDFNPFVPVFVLDADPASVEAMKAKLYDVLHNKGAMRPHCWSHGWRINLINEMMTSLGLTAKKL